MKKFFRFLFYLLILLALVYFAGPRPKSPVLSPSMPQAPTNLLKLKDSIDQSEASLPIKDNNQARIVWVNPSVPQKTHYSLVYLHGFGASQEEGNPLNLEFAQRYGCNLYLGRMAMHGLKDSDAFQNLTGDSLYSTAKMALRIGTRIGDSVILMATSVGGALALTLAAEEQNQPIKALILYSPCVKIFDPKSTLLDKPWGLQIARSIIHGNYLVSKKQDSASVHYWYPKYRLEGTVALQAFLDKSMTPENFKKIKIPVLCLDYYKNEKIQDSTVSVPAIRSMFADLGTPSSEKELHELPNVGDHVLACYIRSKDLPSVEKVSFNFAEKLLNLHPVK